MDASPPPPHTPWAPPASMAVLPQVAALAASLALTGCVALAGFYGLTVSGLVDARAVEGGTRFTWDDAGRVAAAGWAAGNAATQQQQQEASAANAAGRRRD